MELGVKRYEVFFARDPFARKIFTNWTWSEKQKAQFMEIRFPEMKTYSGPKRERKTLSARESVFTRSTSLLIHVICVSSTDVRPTGGVRGAGARLAVVNAFFLPLAPDAGEERRAPARLLGGFGHRPERPDHPRVEETATS